MKLNWFWFDGEQEQEEEQEWRVSADWSAVEFYGIQLNPATIDRVFPITFSDSSLRSGRAVPFKCVCDVQRKLKNIFCVECLRNLELH